MTAPLISPADASDSGGPLLRAVAERTGAPRVTDSHSHARGQLLGATRGLLSVTAGDKRWVVPATHAVWIPPRVPHALRSHGPFAGWSVYVAELPCNGLPRHPRIIVASALLRAAVDRATAWPKGYLDDVQQRLADVIMDEIRDSPEVPLSLPMPMDARLLKIARALSERPDDGRRLDDWAAWAGIAPRTLTRRFLAETGFSFTEWRQRLRLLRALELLAAGKPVGAIALDLGYDNVSAFIALFRRTFGVTPGQYGNVTGDDRPSYRSSRK